MADNSAPERPPSGQFSIHDWPIQDVLLKLAEATEHLLRDHDCDAHGWEGVSYAVVAARIHAADLVSSAPAPLSLFKNAARIHTSWTIDRYLMSNAANRCDPAEKAERHIELCTFYVAAVRGGLPENAMIDYEQDFERLHDESQALTSCLDTEIGFPLDQTPDYTDLNSKFFERFHEIACTALGINESAAPPVTEATAVVAARPRIICLCGSTRFIELFAIKTWELEREGYIVLGCTLLPMWYCNTPSHFGEATGTKDQCDELHKRKIDLADEVLVLNVGGYIGESTRNEIEYATALGKLIRYLEPVGATPTVPSAQPDTPIDVSQPHDFVLIKGSERCGLRGCTLGVLEHRAIPSWETITSAAPSTEAGEPK